MIIRWCETHDAPMFVADACYKKALGVRYGGTDETTCKTVEMVLRHASLPDEPQAYFEMEAEYARLQADLVGLGMTLIQATDAVELVAKWLKAEGGHQGDV